MYTIEKNKKYGFENDNEASLTCFLNSTLRTMGRRYRIGMIILPGGGYSTIQEREADPVAIRYQSYGIQSFVLRYSSKGNDRYVNALKQLCESIALLRQNSEYWDIDPDRIVLCGFSAGGHLAMSLGCYGKPLSEWIKYDIMPNALLLGYPVVTAGSYAHKESIENCINMKKGIDKNSLSLEKHINDATPPVFIWANADDAEVSIQNTTLLVSALANQKISFESHIFHFGGHGVSLGDESTARIEGQMNERYAEWFSLSLTWLQEVI